MVDRLLGDESEPTNWRRRFVVAVAGLFGILILYAVIYRTALSVVADTRISVVQSLQIVLEILTTAGFGGDTGLWREHDMLAALVVLMNLTGVLLVFLAIPLFVVPTFREAFDTTVPTKSSLTDHVVICGYSTMDDVIRQELDEADIPYLFVETDAEKVKQLNKKGLEAIHGNVERVETLRNANFEQARAIVADLDDETNPTVILSADRINPDAMIISVVQNRDAVAHHRYAGADHVVLSKQSLGESLAMRAMKTASERFQDAVGFSTNVQFDEYLVEEGSDLVGQSIKSADVFDEKGITVIGGWFGPRFLVSPSPTTEIVENSILLVTGCENGLADRGVRKLPTHRGLPSRVVVCGYGDVGQAVTNELEFEGIEVTTVDNRPLDRVDVVGDITENSTIQQADVTDARSIVIAVNSDTAAIYATILIKHAAPDVEIIARANDAEHSWKLYNAGADYVLSLPEVTGEVLASALIEESEIFTPQDDFAFARTTAPALTGQTLAEADIRKRTGCTIVGVERDDELLTKLGPRFEIQPDDVLVAAGSEETIEAFRELAGDR